MIEINQFVHEPLLFQLNYIIRRSLQHVSNLVSLPPDIYWTSYMLFPTLETSIYPNAIHSLFLFLDCTACKLQCESKK